MGFVHLKLSFRSLQWYPFLLGQADNFCLFVIENMVSSLSIQFLSLVSKHLRKVTEVQRKIMVALQKSKRLILFILDGCIIERQCHSRIFILLWNWSTDFRPSDLPLGGLRNTQIVIVEGAIIFCNLFLEGLLNNSEMIVTLLWFYRIWILWHRIRCDR